MRLELTKRGDYAVRAMVALTRAEPGTVLSVPRIASAMAIPQHFLPQVMRDLQRAGLVESAPGRNGGYRLGRSPEATTLLDVIEAVEGDARRRSCVLRGVPCGADGQCDLHAVFTRAQDALLAVLAATTLDRLPAAPAENGPFGTS